MADQKEQRVCVKFCFLLGKTAAETVGMLRQTFNDDALGKSQVYEWFSRFKSGNMSTEDMPRPGRPSTGRNDENIAKIKRAIDEDRRKTIDQLSEETNISWSTVQRILTEGLHMRRVSAKFVPRLLGDDQRENRVNVCRDLKTHTALTVRQFLTSNNMVIVPHPPYSPDLAPSDFFLFPRMKRSLKGKRFRDVDEVKENTLKALNSIQPQEFQHCFEQWQKRWDKCINAHGQYFEGD
ncbi:hypothetical protein B7P43_G15767 [Cryptotermes secundus]|uniref:Mos1 transposase HTH domain-containing protein n=1 Tax=Cryptotermes secundus TaxID=105785 RepID=A0A2J7QRB0_9NEOP|nr:hypothetical protein B7P43_G15767 [Cryptotermes secundus]